MIFDVLHIMDVVLWVVMALSVAYILVFAMIYFFHIKFVYPSLPVYKRNKFLVLYPAYKEDKVITESIRKFVLQDYPEERYHVVVIADQMQPATNEALRAMGAEVLVPSFDKSSKAKAMQFAMGETVGDYDFVVVLDADNVVKEDFLTRVNQSCNFGYKAIQCHRCAKNAENDISVLDGISEEINNSLFRRSHNAVGLSSALIGSGMVFDYEWFAANVGKLSTAGEDREIEELLIRSNIFIKYEDDIYVFDEKVSSHDNFQRQRKRWITAQIQCLFRMLPRMPLMLLRGNVNYVNKTVQQALVPRSILLVSLLPIAIVVTVFNVEAGVKWWCLFLASGLAIFLAIPSRMRSIVLVKRLATMFTLTFNMIKNLRHIRRSDTEFHHTEHNVN